MLMTLPLDESPDLLPAAAETHSFTETQRRVEEAVANRAREAGMKDDLRRALYRRMIDSQLAPHKNGRSGNPLKSAGRVAICGFAAFLVILWALGPASLDAIEAVLVAAAASLGLGILSLAILVLCDRLAGRPSTPAGPQAMSGSKDEKALRRLF